MGKRPPPTKNLEHYARVTSDRFRSARAAAAAAAAKPSLKSLDSSKTSSTPSSSSGGAGAGRAMTGGGGEGGHRRLPLSEVVGDCVRRWFQDALKEARSGDAAMQVLVGQMYQSGYGIPRNEQKAKAWIAKASKYRSSVWKVSEKHPGYNASDSDSDEEKDDIKQ